MAITVVHQALTLENIKTDTSKLVDVWMVDLGEEAYLRWSHRIIFREEELQREYAS